MESARAGSGSDSGCWGRWWRIERTAESGAVVGDEREGEGEGADVDMDVDCWIMDLMGVEMLRDGG